MVAVFGGRFGAGLPPRLAPPTRRWEPPTVVSRRCSGHLILPLARLAIGEELGPGRGGGEGGVEPHRRRRRRTGLFPPPLLTRHPPDGLLTASSRPLLQCGGVPAAAREPAPSLSQDHVVSQAGVRREQRLVLAVGVLVVPDALPVRPPRPEVGVDGVRARPGRSHCPRRRRGAVQRGTCWNGRHGTRRGRPPRRCRLGSSGRRSELGRRPRWGRLRPAGRSAPRADRETGP